MVNANITALGPIDNPGITISVFDTLISLGTSPLKVKFDASLEDGQISIFDSSVEMAGQTISDFWGKDDNPKGYTDRTDY